MKPILAVLIVAMQALLGDAYASDRVVLASVAGEPVTSDDIVRRAAEVRTTPQQGPADPKRVADLLDEIIADSLVSKEAAHVNLDKEYMFWAGLRDNLTDAGLRLYQDEVLVPQLTFDSAQIGAYYRSNIGRYTVQNPQRLVRHITAYIPGQQIPVAYGVMDTVYRGWDPQVKIESIYQRLCDGEDFATLARIHSEEPHSKPRGGVLGWVSKASLPKDAFGEMCLSLPLHQISKPFKSSVGWHIVQITGIREPGPSPIEGIVLGDITRSLHDSIGNELAKHVVDSLVNSGSFEIVDKALEIPDSLLLLTPGEPMAVGNKRDTIYAAQYTLVVSRAQGGKRLAPTSRQERAENLRAMYPRLVLYGALRTWGYLTRPEVTSLRAESIHRHACGMVRALFTGSDCLPDSAAIDRYYHTHPAEFAAVQRYLIHVLKFIDPAQAEKTAADWKSGTQPDSLETAWVGKGDVPQAIWSVIARTPVGKVLDPIPVNGQYWVVRLSDQTKPKTLSEAAPVIRTKLQEEHYAQLKKDWIRKVTARYAVARYPERYGQVVFP